MLIWCDSFDHWNNSQKLQKYEEAGTDGGYVSSGAARFGAGGLTLGASGGAGRWRLGKTFPFSRSELIIGFAFLMSAWGNTADIVRIQDSGTVHTTLRVGNTGVLSVTRNGTLLSTGVKVLNLSAWHYLEFKCLIADAGSFEVRVDGVTDISASADTRNGANASANQVYLFGQNNDTGSARLFDDYYICDTIDSGIPGVPNDDFLGDVRVQGTLPSGNGATSQMLGSDADSVDNYLLVDEAAPDSDTTYVASDTVGEKDTYAFGDVSPAAGTVYGVQLVPWIRKDDAGARSFASVARHSGGAEEDGPDTPLSTSYTYYTDVREADPNGDAWTIASVNAAEFGVKVTV